ncbi:MAG: hypothetical protein JGK03_15405 [Microcoleus sp. PH2017_25_DOB_D_A]|uniref:hypothetical protein n=1 Tax=unclassified Microcoleus TaxID=2642155 RepID=UPI001D51BFBE|nr:MULTISPECIES: hypothetical protein [unclassified Microcoleus]MCC3509508.1 hypothetical protein [Microcoleus sp. PH2017_17_BER_D_A]TAE40421.1 MAG: hypothetical protein EAZ90_20275 [Oscillatoriales cyanobacterium]MCC3499439.1 hypothetical protein [Microcoleus sp. PH2017_15_JOR_U_A]MCC3535559.1 hypothetical protein [Microcoleus sp. PH2017_25_DOB_D_A]MCC3545473.1 hypothetical protein [Microcoleus sp. PH2017_24_DOB_U_A]
MDFINFLQNINSNINSAIISVLNLVLFIELTAACCQGIYRGWAIGEATVGKIFLLTTIAAIMFRLWQSWPQEWVWFAAWPQCAFVVFAGGLAGCTLKWGVERVLLRS